MPWTLRRPCRCSLRAVRFAVLSIRPLMLILAVTNDECYIRTGAEVDASGCGCYGSNRYIGQ